MRPVASCGCISAAAWQGARCALGVQQAQLEPLQLPCGARMRVCLLACRLQITPGCMQASCEWMVDRMASEPGASGALAAMCDIVLGATAPLWLPGSGAAGTAAAGPSGSTGVGAGCSSTARWVGCSLQCGCVPGLSLPCKQAASCSAHALVASSMLASSVLVDVLTPCSIRHVIVLPGPCRPAMPMWLTALPFCALHAGCARRRLAGVRR